MISIILKPLFVSEIDACSINNGGCDHICESTSVGRRCICRLGFALDVDGVTCIGMSKYNLAISILYEQNVKYISV